MKINKPFKPIFRLYLYLRDKFNPKPIISEEERYAVSIVKKLVECENSELFYSPISVKRLIKNQQKNIYIVVTVRNITIINHTYSYSVYIESDDLYESLIMTFDGKLESKRAELETEIKNNIKHSLQNILENISVEN